MLVFGSGFEWGNFVSFVMAATEKCLSRSAMERDLSLDQAGNRVL